MPEYEVCVDTNNIKYVCLFSEAVFVHTIFIIKYWPIYYCWTIICLYLFLNKDHGACSVDPKPGLIRFFFHPVQCFSLTDSAINSKIQPLQCFFYVSRTQPLTHDGIPCEAC